MRQYVQRILGIWVSDRDASGAVEIGLAIERPSEGILLSKYLSLKAAKDSGARSPFIPFLIAANSHCLCALTDMVRCFGGGAARRQHPVEADNSRGRTTLPGDDVPEQRLAALPSRLAARRRKHFGTVASRTIPYLALSSPRLI